MTKQTTILTDCDTYSRILYDHTADNVPKNREQVSK